MLKFTKEEQTLTMVHGLKCTNHLNMVCVNNVRGFMVLYSDQTLRFKILQQKRYCRLNTLPGVL